WDAETVGDRVNHCFGVVDEQEHVEARVGATATKLAEQLLLRWLARLEQSAMELVGIEDGEDQRVGHRRDVLLARCEQLGVTLQRDGVEMTPKLPPASSPRVRDARNHEFVQAKLLDVSALVLIQDGKRPQVHAASSSHATTERSCPEARMSPTPRYRSVHFSSWAASSWRSCVRY